MSNQIEKNLHKLEQIIGYDFHNPMILRNAMTHSSYGNERGLDVSENNERLEFLGDAVLELVSSDYLYHAFSEQEGKLTKLRASMVCEPSLAFCAKEIQLGNFLLLGKGEENTGGRERDSVTSDALEALIGAIYLDGGLEEARRFIMDHVLNDLEHKKLFYDSKTVLQEMLQSMHLEAPEYIITGESGPAHLKKYCVQAVAMGKVLGSGTGPTKKAAAQNAAYEAILNLKREH